MNEEQARREAVWSVVEAAAGRAVHETRVVCHSRSLVTATVEPSSSSTLSCSSSRAKSP